MTPTLDDYIRAATSAFKAPRGETLIHAGGRAMRVHTKGERILHLSNGQTVRVSVDDSGVATQVEEDEALHAIVRPRLMDYRLVLRDPQPAVSARTRPIPIRTSAIPRRTR
jgi:hypothetical protein